MLPWYIFLFVGAFDSGFYAYGLIATSNAARIAATYCSASSVTCSTVGEQATVCTNYVITQLNYMPNMGSGRNNLHRFASHINGFVSGRRHMSGSKHLRYRVGSLRNAPAIPDSRGIPGTAYDHKIRYDAPVQLREKSHA